MRISSAGSRSRLLIAIKVLTLNFRREINENRAFQQTPVKHHRIVTANIGLKYWWTEYGSSIEHEAISNGMWLINIHELVPTRL